VVLVAVGSISFALLAGCNDSTGADPNSEAFKGPLTTELLVKPDTSCPGGEIGFGDTVRVTGFDYLPDSIVDLRWTDLNSNDTSSLDSVTATKNGDFTTEVKIFRGMAQPGDTLRISSQGSSETGILVLKTDLLVENC
jgi:hypothetical protein